MKKTIMWAASILLSLLTFCVSSAGMLGDVDNDGDIGLSEAVHALRVSSGVQSRIPASYVIVWRGSWALDEEYHVYDAVQHDGSSYICIQEHTSEPSNSPPYQTTWNILALEGEQGPQGETGVQGPQGPPGPSDADTLDGMDSTEFAHAVHDHSFSDITGQATDDQIPNSIVRDSKLNEGLSGKANVVHDHDSRYYTQSEVDSLVSDLETRIAALEAKLASVTIHEGTINGMPGPHMIITGANIHVRSGSGATSGTINGRGNLIIGYNEIRGSGNDNRSGSHCLVVGQRNNFSSYGGLVAGYYNTVSGAYASVSGGEFNTASGVNSSVSGGYSNEASASDSSVSGGYNNAAGGGYSSVSGGAGNTASGNSSSVSGGENNEAGAYASSVSGGYGRSVSGSYDWQAGGYFQTQ
jgi:hypothetical protein